MRPPPSATTALDPRGLGLILLVCLLWGGSIPIIKASETDLPPLLMAAGRVAVAVVLLAAYGARRRQRLWMPPSRRGHGPALGALFGLTMILLYLGLRWTSAADGTIFFSTKPFFVALGAHFLLPGDRLTFTKLAGLLLALVGITLAFALPGAVEARTDWGNIMELGGAVSFSATTLYTKWLSRSGGLSPLQLLFTSLVYALPVLSIAALLLEAGQPIVLGLPELIAFGYQSAGVQFLSYLLWFGLISHYSVSRITSFVFLVPLIGVVLSAAFLGETTTAGLWWGLVLVMTGILVVNAPSRTAALPGR